MFQKAFVLAALVAVLLAARAAARDRALPPVEAFASLPALTDVQLSPDGQHIAAVQVLDGRPDAVIYSVVSPRDKPAIIPFSEWLVRGVKWAKNDRLLIFLGRNESVGWDSKQQSRSWGRTLALSPNGENPVLLFGDNRFFKNNTQVTSVADVDLDDPDAIYMPFTIFTAGRYSFLTRIYRVNVRTGHTDVFATGGSNTAKFLMDGHGKVVARLDESWNPLKESVEVYVDGSWEDAGSYDTSGDKSSGIDGVSDDGKDLVRLAPLNSGTRSLFLFDAKTKKESVLYTNPSYDIASTLNDPWTGRVIGAAYAADAMHYVYFDSQMEALQNGLEAAFPGLSVTAVSFDLARDKVIALVDGPRDVPAYYLVNRTTHNATFFGKAYPGLQSEDLGEMKLYDYTARDGLHIPAFITLPPGRKSTNLPAIVMPHGGPDYRDTIAFDWWREFLANRGYVVLQPNFRGSSGYGRSFTEAGLHQWGLKMQDDISDGVKQMVTDGIADPKRICIVGASYGGYAALAGAAFTPDLYACAVSIAGVADLPMMLRRERAAGGKEGKLLSFWTSRIGSIYDDSDALRATSPARHADQVKCPILLMHGDQDSTVPIEQSETMADALTSAGKQVEFVKLDGDDHYLELSATRVKILTELETFLKANIGN